MEPTNWAPEHSDALREHLAKGMSFSEIAKAINSKFKTAYSRNAALGRARRMGLAGTVTGRTASPSGDQPPRCRADWRHSRRPNPGRPSFIGRRRCSSGSSRTKLRCVEIEPRHLSLIDLEHGDCRYPYGGDEEGEAITFCGHPRRTGSSYCTPHFHLSRNPVPPSERTASTVSLRLVEAA